MESVLYLNEIMHMKLKADLVVISACDTGLGKFQRGEGILSMARGFTYAGAKSILTTLWNIDDQKTPILMKQFYRFLHQGMSKGMALHQAKLYFLDHFSNEETHPYYWAPFILIGDNSVIEHPYPHRIKSLVSYSLAGLLLLGMVVWIGISQNWTKRNIFLF